MAVQSLPPLKFPFAFAAASGASAIGAWYWVAQKVAPLLPRFPGAPGANPSCPACALPHWEWPASWSGSLWIPFGLLVLALIISALISLAALALGFLLGRISRSSCAKTCSCHSKNPCACDDETEPRPCGCGDKTSTTQDPPPKYQAAIRQGEN